MGDNHPALIAKYLLKGYCLLNEYCQKGHSNTPLVRSRDGQLICVRCENEGAPEQTTSTDADETATASAPGPKSVPMEVETPTLAPTLPSLSTTPLRIGGSAASARAAEVTLEVPECRFNCIHLDYRRGGMPRLLGNTYTAKVRASLASLGSSPDVSSVLQEAFANAACAQIRDRVLIPQSCAGAEISRSAGQVRITCTKEDGHFVLPERECTFLPGVVPELIAKHLMDLLLGREGLSMTLQSSGVRWLEVSLSTVDGAVSYQRAV